MTPLAEWGMWVVKNLALFLAGFLVSQFLPLGQWLRNLL